MNRGEGCKDCLANGGCVSPEECMGCNGQVSCNHDYFPKSYDHYGKRIDTPKEKRKERFCKLKKLFNFK